MYFLLNLNYYVKSYRHLSQMLALFTMPALQIWPCHVTQEANFKKILFFPNFAFNIGKSCKISSRKALYVRSYQLKTSRGWWKTPPASAFRVKSYPKYTFEKFEPLCQMLWAFLSNCGSFYHAHSSNMVMSSDQVANFEIFFVLTLHLIFQKVTKFLVENLYTLEVEVEQITPIRPGLFSM